MIHDTRNARNGSVMFAGCQEQFSVTGTVERERDWGRPRLRWFEQFLQPHSGSDGPVPRKEDYHLVAALYITSLVQNAFADGVCVSGRLEFCLCPQTAGVMQRCKIIPWRRLLRPSSEAQLHVLWNTKIYYHAHNNLLFIPVLRHTNLVPYIPKQCINMRFNIISPFTPRSLEWSLSFRSLVLSCCFVAAWPHCWGTNT
jgi:hypothetical protein